MPVGPSSAVPPPEVPTPDEDEEVSSFAPLDEASLTSPPPLLVPPEATARSVGPPLAHAAPTTRKESPRIAVLVEKLVEPHLTQRMDLCSVYVTQRASARRGSREQ
jgi:hypothetical protein